jgi:hypothetical protein
VGARRAGRVRALYAYGVLAFRAGDIFQKLTLSESALENKRVHAVLTYLRA